MNNFKKLLIKYFDSNGNQKLEFSEIMYPIVFLFFIEVFAGTASNFLYDVLKSWFK
jgi:hypothetical protein